MKRAALLTLLCLLLSACTFNIKVNGDDGLVSYTGDYGDAVGRPYALDRPYNQIEVSSAFQVLMSDTVVEPRIFVAEELHDRVVFRVDGNTLKIRLKPGNYRNVGTLRVHLPYQGLREVELSGASRFVSEKPLVVRELALDLSGASRFIAEVQAREVDIDASGASKAILSGTADELDIDLAGASHLDATNLDTKRVEGEVSGASHADVTVCDLVKVDLSGASHLTYGTPGDGCRPDYRCNTSGASSVKQR